MPNKTILVTGATGFVGNRLTERLVLGTDYSVTALIHRFSGPGLTRLARLPVNLVQADLLDEKSLLKAAENCHIIVHLAYGSTGDEDMKKKVTVSGTENILKVAIKNDIRKVIFFSTAAVHGIAPKAPVVNESSPFEKSNDIYRSSKSEAEEFVWKYYNEYQLPVVVFRPPLIYGPYGFYWTTRIVKEIKSGAVLVNDGNGTANLVYVDNLIDAVLLALENDRADGEAFIVVDDDSMTWKQIYEAYAGLIDTHPPLRSMSVEEIEVMRKGHQPNDLKSWFVKPFFLVPEIVKSSFRLPETRRKMMEIPWLRFMKNRLSRNTLNDMKYGENANGNESTTVNKLSSLALPPNDLVQLYSSQAQFSNEKIKRILGYKQRIDFWEALTLIESWLRYQPLIP